MPVLLLKVKPHVVNITSCLQSTLVSKHSIESDSSFDLTFKANRANLARFQSLSQKHVSSTNLTVYVSRRYPQAVAWRRTVYLRRNEKMKRHLSRLAVALLICLLAALAYVPLARTRAAEKTAPVAFSATGKPFLNTQNARTVAVKYSGDASVVAEMQSGAAARALIAADVDADGAPDLVAGYKTASDGAVAITRGNPDAFAPKDARIYAQAIKGKVPPAFLSKTVVFSVPEAPDYLASADFSHHGYRDVLTATRGGGMYLLTGDGAGNFSAATRINLPGDVSAFVMNPGGHVAVAVQTGGATKVLVFDTQSKSGFNRPVATYALSGSASAMAWGRLGFNTADLAVASGSSVTVYYNALKQGGKSDTLELAFRPQALALGDFTWDRDNRLEIAALAEDGSVHILEHGTLDTRAVKVGGGPARRAQRLALRKASNLDPTTMGAWKDARNFPATSGVTDGVALQSLLRTSETAPSGLLALDSGSRHINLMQGASSTSTSSISLSAAPIATVDLPSMVDGKRGVAVLTSGDSSIKILPLATINISVTSTADGAGCPANTLRGALCTANSGASGNTYEIDVPAGTYSLSSGELEAGGSGARTIVINGNTGNAADVILKQTDGGNRVIEQDFDFNGSQVLVIQNATLTGGHCSSGTDCVYGGGAILGTGTTGDNLTLTNVVIDSNSSTAGVGGGVNTSADGNFTVTNSTFSNNSTNQAAGGAFQFAPDPISGSLTVSGSTFKGNSVTGSAAQGGALVLLPNAGNSASITSSTFTSNTIVATSSAAGGGVSATGNVSMSNSRVFGNTVTVTGSGTFSSGWLHSGGAGNTATLTNNWWGCNAGPSSGFCNIVFGTSGTTVNFTPWLVLGISASPSTQILPAGAATINVDLAHNSAAATGFNAPDTTPLSFGATSFGTLGSSSGTFTSGQFSTGYTAGATAGNDNVAVTVDNQTVTVAIHVLDTVSFDTNPTGLQYHVDGTSYTTPQTFHWVVGSSHPVVADSPQDAGGGQQYSFGNWSDSGAASHSITAPTADTSYTAAFNLSPAFTSGNSVQFVENTNGTFSVTATGNPAPTFSEVGALPSGVTLASDGTLSGTPANGTAGVYPISITATNGVSPDATQSFTLTVRAQGIDLVEENVSVQFTAPAPNPRKNSVPGGAAGGAIYITETALNQGVTSSPLTRTTMYLSSDGVTLTRGLVFRNVPQLASGDSSRITSAATLPSGINGTYYVIACADSLGQAAESHENNNCSTSASFNVLGADLVETTVTVPPTTTGAKIDVSDTATNSGPGSAGTSRTNFYISSNGVTQDRAVGFRNVPALASSANSAGITTLTLPAGTTGTYYIIACADTLAQVPETDETNNCTTSTTPFNAPLADLTESSVSVPATVTGATVAVSDTVGDSGASAGSSRTTFYISTDGTTLGTSLAFRNVPGLASGSSSTGNTSLTLPVNTKGTYYIIACADTTNAVSESDETNNCAASNSFSSAGPDLGESAVSVTTASPVSGGSISVNDTAMNSGSAASSSRTLFYISTDGSTKGVQIAFRDVLNLAGGGSSSGTTSMTLPGGISGTYYIIACANATNTVPESNTANNCSASSGFTVGGADLVETSVSVPSSASGGVIEVTDTAQNNGPGAAGTSRTTFYLSSDGSTITRGLGFRNVPALGNGAIDTNSTALTLPSGLSGTYYVIACADSLNTVSENNETNNCSSSGAFTAP